MTIEEMEEDLDLDFWSNEDNLLLFEALILTCPKEFYRLYKDQKISIDKAIEIGDIKSAFSLYHCPGPDGHSVKDIHMLIEDLKANEPSDVLRDIINEVKKRKNVES